MVQELEARTLLSFLVIDSESGKAEAEITTTYTYWNGGVFTSHEVVESQFNEGKSVSIAGRLEGVNTSYSFSSHAEMTLGPAQYGPGSLDAHANGSGTVALRIAPGPGEKEGDPVSLTVEITPDVKGGGVANVALTPFNKPGTYVAHIGDSITASIDFLAELTGVNDIGTPWPPITVSANMNVRYTVSPALPPDIEATSLAWNSGLGGVDYTYSIKNSPLPKPATVALYWSPTTTFDPSTATRIQGTEVTTEIAVRDYPPVHINASTLATPPGGTKYLLVVADPPSNSKPSGEVAESNENNNILFTTITVAEVNHAPLLGAIGNRVVNEGSLLPFTIVGSDPDTGPGAKNVLTYSASGLPAGATLDSSTGAFAWTPTEAQDGSYSVTFTVTDNGTPALSASETITITVAEVNQAPLLGAIGNRVVNEGSLLPFTIVGSDPDTGPGAKNVLTYSASGLPAGATLDSSTGAFAWTPTEAQDGSYSVTFTVTDNGTPALSASETITITVAEVNQAPLLGAIGNRVVNEGSLLPFTIAGSDPDTGPGAKNVLTYSASGLPAGATLDSSTGAFAWTPTEAQDGSYSVTFTVTDNGTPALSASETITITVAKVNHAPRNIVLNTDSIDENSIFTLVGSFDDPDVLDLHTIAIDWGEGIPQVFTLPVGLRAFEASHRYIDDRPSATTSDVYTIDVLVYDGIGSSTDSSSVVINNIVPAVSLLTNTSPDGEVEEGQTVFVRGLFSDIGVSDTHTATVSWGDGTTTNASVLERQGFGRVAGSHIYANGGIYTLALTVADDDGGTVVKTTQAVVAGAGIRDKVLYIVGTNGDDDVMVSKQRIGDSQATVQAGFLPNRLKRFTSSWFDSIIIYLGDGDDKATVSVNITTPTLMSGGRGADLLNGGGGSSILLGGGGNDTLNGGSARDLVIGGGGRDKLVGNGADDILIGGSTIYDGTTSYDIDVAALQAIMDEWNGVGTYQVRTGKIRRGFLKVGRTIKLGGGNVIDNLAADVLTGSAGQDWYFLSDGDSSSGRRPDEANG
ncbi:putative Ig domain-containing protein [Singulisphaera sp. Ch08]|uniref:Ig domain-containing protein n=1 Tax=Singulisphaera sp. Ch08 TaxID=3120278 RepID=A0AAU7CT72_9BACT